MVYVLRLTKDFTIQGNSRIGSNDQIFLIVPQRDQICFCSSDSLHILSRLFVNSWRLINLWWINYKLQIQFF